MFRDLQTGWGDAGRQFWRGRGVGGTGEGATVQRNRVVALTVRPTYDCSPPNASQPPLPLFLSAPRSFPATEPRSSPVASHPFRTVSTRTFELPRRLPARPMNVTKGRSWERGRCTRGFDDGGEIFFCFSGIAEHD